MRTIARGIVASLVWLPCAAAAQDCPTVGGAYEGFQVTRVSVDTPLRFPVHWIERALLGPAIDALDPEAQGLPIQQGRPFHFLDHVQTERALSDRYTYLRPGERMKFALVLPRFPSCDLSARTVDVAYRVYSTDAAYFASRLLEVPQDRPARGLTIGKPAETNGKILPVPFVGYNKTRSVFGGVATSWQRKTGVLNSVRAEAAGSSSSYRAAVSAGGSHDPGEGALSHVEWSVGGRVTKDPAEALTLQESIGKADFFAATRAQGRLATLLRFGGAFEAGRVDSGTAAPGLLSAAPKRSLKSYLGGAWSHDRQRWNVSYGFELGKGTDATPVDFQRHLLDAAYQVRLLPREHWPIQLDTHVNAGWISSGSTPVPVADRFFGGNVVSDFINNPLWKIAAGPLIRSVPQNALNAVDGGQPFGGTSFTAVNVTAAFPAWGIPAMPRFVRHAKPLADGIHFGLQRAQAASLEDYLARTPQFPAVLKRAGAVVPDLESVRDRLVALTNQALPDDLKDDLNDLLTAHIAPALEKIQHAQRASRNGVAWNACRILAGMDVDTFPLAHLHEDLGQVVAPGLEAVNRGPEAQALRELGERFEAHRRAIAALLDPIARAAAVDATQLSALRPALAGLAAHATRLKNASDAVRARPEPVGSLAVTASEWSTAVLNSADLPADSDPSDELYTLGRLALGIGALVPPQIGSAASAGMTLAAALSAGGDAGAAREIAEASQNLSADLAALAPRVRALRVPAAERWAREQNGYFVRALDVAFREMTLAGVRYVVSLDAARLGPSPNGRGAFRYGIGPGIQFSIVTFQVTMGYSFNPDRRPTESRGAFFFIMDVADLFR